jgi:hypothetical protein
MGTGGLKMVVFVGLVVLGLVVLAGGFGEWLLFGLFLWGLFAILGPGRHHRHHRRRRDRMGLNWQGPTQQFPTQVYPRFSDVTAGRLPVDVQIKVETIRRKAEALVQYADYFPTGSQDLYVVQRTTIEYLPNTINAYLALPPGYANATVSADGKTALQALWEQLNLLEAKLDEIASNVHRQNLDRLVANGRFLEERFGDRSSELDRLVAR